MHVRRTAAAAILLLAACAAPLAPSGSPLVGELRDAGLVMADSQPVSQPFLSVEGRVYAVDGGDLQLFDYATEEAARSDAAKIQPDGNIETMKISWMAPPHFYRRGATLAIYIGTNPRSLQVLRGVLGPPFAERR